MDLTGSKDSLKVAVLLATFNGEKYLEDLLESLASQTFLDFEIFVHDDGSKDRTSEILSSWSLTHPGILNVLEGAPCGSAKANFLWMLKEVTDFDYYLFCDQDDVWLPQKIEKCFDTMKSMETEGEKFPVCVFSDMYVTDASLNIISDSFISYIGRSGHNTAYSQILIDNPAAGCTMLINKSLRDRTVWAVKSCGMNLSRLEMHDGLVLTLASIYGKIAFVDEPLVYYRQTGFNEMGAKNENAFSKVKRNLLDLFSGKTFSLKREFVERSRIFALELLKLDDLPSDVREVLTGLVAIKGQRKLARMRFYKKNNFTRAKGNLWMRLWV